MKAFFKTLTILLLLSFQQTYANAALPGSNKTIRQSGDTTEVKKPVAFAPYGIVNIFNNPVVACQIAAIGNITRDRSTGFQCSGIFNTAKEHHGAQVGGIINNAGKSSGIQIGGIINRSGNGNSVQIAGVVNTAQSDSSGLRLRQPLQIAGLVNTSYGANAQLAGIGNITSSPAELQIAGIFNRCAQTSQSQIAGIVNMCTESNGVQIAGIVNKCSSFKGVQIGLVNISDTCRGVQIGLINIVRKNMYMKLELSGDEMFYANIGLRSGTRKLHGIVSAGMHPDDFKLPLWNTGVGMGSEFPIGSKTFLSMDAMHYQIYSGHHCGDNYLTRLNIGIDHMVSSKLSLYGGVTFNLLFTDDDSPEYNDVYSSIAPYHFTEFNWFGDNVKPWVGIKVGLRLF